MVVRIEKRVMFILAVVVVFLTGVFLVSRNMFENGTQDINLLAIFLTGLLTGGLTCLAVQGGLLAATIAQRSPFAKASLDKEEEKLQEREKQSGNAIAIIAFLVAKLVAYTIFGFLLGWLGSLFQLSITAQVVMQTAVVIFMLGTALNLLNVHPIFRYFIIQPPKFLTRLVRKRSKSKSLFAPALLGAFTVFIPCGTTQAMMALAVGSANPLMGAVILFAFVLGTSPLFFILGYFATKLGDSLHQKFLKIAALALILLALFNVNNVLALTGSSWTLNTIFRETKVEKSTFTQTPQQEVVISVLANGYSPNTIAVKAGSTVKFTIKNNGVYTCAAAFTIPYFNYQQVIQPGTSETVTLKMPDEQVQIPFMCSMGMYRGVINVL